MNAFAGRQPAPPNLTAAAAGAPLPAQGRPDGANAFGARQGTAEATAPVANSAGRFAAARRAEIIGALAGALAKRPYAERRALLAHMARDLAGVGVDPRAVADFDPTDVNLAAAAGQAESLRRLLS